MTVGELICDALKSIPEPTPESLNVALDRMNHMLADWNKPRRGPALQVEPMSFAEIDEQYRSGRLGAPVEFQWYFDPADSIKLWPEPTHSVRAQ